MSTSNGNNSPPPSPSSSTALAIIPRSLDDVRALVKAVAGSALLPPDLRREPDIQMAVMTGLELGLTPMAAIRGISVIKGKPTLNAATMVAIVLGRGAAEYFECIDDKGNSVTYETKRVNGRNPQRATWTMEDAKRAGLHGDNWNKYPSDMLHARCMARLARRVYPDLLAGIYTPDEIENSTFEPSLPPPVDRHPDAVDAEIVSESTSAEPDLAEMIAAAETEAALETLIPRCNALAKGSTERALALSAWHAKKDRMVKAKAEAAAKAKAAAKESAA